MAGMWSIPGLMILYLSLPTDNDNDMAVTSGSSNKNGATCNRSNEKKKEVVSLSQYIKAACSSLLITSSKISPSNVP